MAESTSQEPASAMCEGGSCFSSLLLLTDEDFRHVHPEDLATVRQHWPHGWQLLCFRYDGRYDGYDVLADGELRVRVRNAVIRPIPEPQFRRGDQVFAHPKQAIGVVRQVVWHLNRGQVYYSLAFGDRPSGRWYFESDLGAPSSTEQVAPPD